MDASEQDMNASEQYMDASEQDMDASEQNMNASEQNMNASEQDMDTPDEISASCAERFDWFVFWKKQCKQNIVTTHHDGNRWFDVLMLWTVRALWKIPVKRVNRYVEASPSQHIFSSS